MARDFGCRPSQMYLTLDGSTLLESDSTAACNLDATAEYVLLKFDNERQKAQADYLVSKIAELFSGTESEE